MDAHIYYFGCSSIFCLREKIVLESIGCIPAQKIAHLMSYLTNSMLVDNDGRWAGKLSIVDSNNAANLNTEIGEFFELKHFKLSVMTITFSIQIIF